MGSALRSWELENAVELIDPNRDGLYIYDAESQKKQNEARPWRSDPHHFKSVRISATALIKMVMHARSGGTIEVMGLMMGYIAGDAFVVTDAFRLPVEGTETRVNAQAEGLEYMVSYLEKSREAGQQDNAVGWYHSHPGYGCWLSGVDVNTQMLQQQGNDPFVAVVIDPDQTISAGKVEIGAFRTFPENHKSAEEGDGEVDSDGFQTIPLEKMEDFGAHSARYYPLEISHFKSTLDSKLLESLWNKYWVSTLSSSPLFTNKDYGTKQIAELGLKIKQAEKQSGQRGVGPMGSPRKDDSRYDKIVSAGNKIAAEEKAGIMTAELKRKLFNGVGQTRSAA